MCEACEERHSIAMATDKTRKLQFCALCLSDALAVGWLITVSSAS